MMGIPHEEKILNSVNGILKSLECAICLELLQTPVSTGCGHFFCRFCITETLQSNYRKPCPLCKKSFTRRGIQEATQRLTVIKAAKKLAEICGKVTGINFFPKENSQKICAENSSVSEADNSFCKCEENFKPLNSRKRKSDERSLNDDLLESDMPVLSQKHALETSNSWRQNFSSTENVNTTSNKRACPAKDLSDEDDELPSLESLIPNQSKSKDVISNGSEKNAVNAMPNLSPKSNLSTTEIHDSQKGTLNQTTETVKPCMEDNSKSDQALIIRRKAPKMFAKSKDKNLLKNKKNALKNKTNISDENDSVKNYEKNLNCCKIISCNDLSENENLLKRNDNSSMKPSKKAKTSNVYIKSKKKNQKPNSSLNSVEENNLIEKISDAENYLLNVENTQINQNVDNLNGECYELAEITMPCANNIQLDASNMNKNLKSDEITDTAISVHTVVSPQISKTIISSKSPGWSRVKKVRKDFRVKKFSKLQVEKNNSSLSTSDDIKTSENSALNASDIEPKFQKISDVELMDNEYFDLNDKPIAVTKDLILESPLQQETINKEKLTNLCEDKNPAISEFSPRDITHADDVIKEKTNSEELKTVSNVPLGNQNKNKIINKTGSSSFQDSSFKNSSNLFNKINSTDNDEYLSSNLGSCLVDGQCSISSKVDQPKIALRDDVSDFKFQENICSNILPANLDANYENQINNLHDAESHVIESGNQLQSVTNNIPNTITELSAECSLDKNVSFKADFTNKQLVNKKTNDFFKPQMGLVKESRISKISKISKCKSPEIAVQNEGIYYVEHSQQTSQRLGFYDSKNKNFPSSTLIPAPNHYPNTFASNMLLNYAESALAPWKPIRENMCPEKTKVVKRTCLTLEEIQDFFIKSNLSGKSETVSSIPFLSGNYKLHIGVCEETLNISVLKVMEPETNGSDLANLDTINVEKPKKTLIFSEKCIQTSVNNTPILSSSVLPSSNAASDVSQSDNDSDFVRPNYNAIPYLSKFFSDSESTPLLHDASNIAVKNTTEVLPLSFTKTETPKSPLQINETLNNTINHEVISTDGYKADASSESSKTDVCVNSAVCENLPVDSKDVEMVDVSTQDSLVPDSDSSILNDFSAQNKKDLSCLKNDYSKIKIINSLSEDLHLKESENKNTAATQFTHSTKISDEYNAFSSDPYMAFADELVAPLKNIAEKINSVSNICKKTESQLSICMVPSQRNADEKNASNNHDNILNYLKENSLSNKNLKQKPSRLSLKQKRNSKFKRIQSFDSDSDDSEMAVNNTTLKQSTMSDIRNKFSSFDSKAKSKEMLSTTLQDQNTLNSILSDDVNPIEIVREIEDIDEKIKFLEEQLKQCGHTDLVSEENLNLLKSIRDKELLDSGGSSSEDSDDIFSQSIPPTPQDVSAVNGELNHKNGKRALTK